jgi:hypothetical protein
MAYVHNKVVDIERRTKTAIDRVASSEWVTNPPTNVRTVRTYKTIPISDELWEFMEKLRKEIPSIEFGLPSKVRAQDISIGTGNTIYPIRVMSEMVAYLPNDVYTLGSIGYADYCVTKAKDNKKRVPSYMVSSRNIENKKFDSYREHASMLLAKNLETAIVNAKKHLRPYAPIEIARVEMPDVETRVRAGTDNFRRAAENAQYMLGKDSVIMQELIHLVTSGYEFVNSKAQELIFTAITANQEYVKSKDKVVTGKFVSVSSQFGVQMVDIIPTMKLSEVHDKDWEGDGSMRYRLSEAPEDIMGGIAVLSMVETERYIEGVGSRLGDTTFWVQDDEATT